ncbi:universal stress protein [Arachidicoccus ginsenosidivorans]|jgi:nucleotide-binding universal stress UspA family protein|uniref:Universal stress protein n=1 Tax=Arachidicoccus ginsenosidivorans TaxID=496057 RepID=A0A5B8VGY9_9BACT|nr:universal stress protein [Arachidicoccus ginsenosidivorans]QEC70730.1 universal stress protein [Arachidicoccus ginsenosidivorans]
MGQEINRILIAIDDSRFSKKAAKTGFSLAYKTQSLVALVYVVDSTKEQVNADLGITAKESETNLLNAARRTIEEYIKLYDGKQQVACFTPIGIPEEEILIISEEWRANLIVMGTHGRSAIGRILSGSKAEYVVRHATVPVLLTPPRML